MAVGIKVVDETTGTPPGLAAATVRTALRLVDGLASYFVAFIAVLAAAKRQRLGDVAAHIVVVRVTQRHHQDLADATLGRSSPSRPLRTLIRDPDP